MIAKGGKWTDKNLDKYLKSPADFAPGKNYNFYSILVMMSFGLIRIRECLIQHPLIKYIN